MVFMLLLSMKKNEQGQRPDYGGHLDNILVATAKLLNEKNPMKYKWLKGT